MFGRLKSSLEKRAPGVVDALRGLRGGRESEPPAPVVKPAVTKPAAAPKAEAAKPAAAPKAEAAKPAAAPTAEAATPAAAPTAEAAKPAAAPKAEAAKPAAAPKAEAATPAAAPKAEAAKPAAAPKADPHADAKPAADKKPKHLHADTGSTDVDAYIARARANGRDVALIKGTEGINVAEDGVAYAGPLDNESSRAKAAKKLLAIDQFECISCGTCVEQTEHVFYLPADGKATPIAQEGPMDLIQDAIEACPVTCIHWVSPDEAVERGLATGVEG